MNLLIQAVRWLARRWQPAGGWGLWFTVMVAALWPAWALGRTAWIRGSTLPLTETALLAAMVAWALFSWARDGRLRGVLLALSAYPVLLVGIARAWPPFRLLMNALVHTVTWAISGGQVGHPVRAWAAWADVLVLRVLVFHGELSTWLAAVRGGTVTGGRTALLTLFGLLVYANACWVVESVRGRNDGVRAAVPGLFITGWNMYWAGEGVGWPAGMLALAVLLSTTAHYAHLEGRWQRRKMDFSDQLRLDFAVVGVGVALAAIVMTPVITTLTSPHLYTRVRGFLARPWARVETETARLFPDVERPARSPLGRSTAATMPRARKLGASPQLLDTLVMRVRPREGPLPPHAYFFGLAYDVYTGSGWMQSPWQVDGLAAGEEWAGPVGRERLLVEHTITLASPTREVYAAGVPVAVDRPADALTFAGKDLLGMRLKQSASTYTVMGAVPAVDEERLRTAGTAYPNWITVHYLQVPESVPARVRRLAREITRRAYSPYDKARAIEAHLRQIPYSLDVPVPPPDRDVVDWFLFDLRRGYCDYYATAFVVLARLNGLPARLAVGYAQGAWAEKGGEYRITEREAHSWPEVYFPGYGWIPFEPTASREIPRWPEISTARPPHRLATWQETLTAFRAWAAARWRAVLLYRVARAVLILILAVLGAILLWWGYWLWRVPRPARAYAQLLWLARRLGVRWQPGWTPLEFEEAVLSRLAQLPVPAAWQKRASLFVGSAVRAYIQWQFGT